MATNDLLVGVLRMSESVLPARFDEDLVETLLELLLAYGVRARVGYLNPELTRVPMLASVVPFVGPGFNGSLMLAASRNAIAATHSTVVCEVQLRDWIGELGSQTLGCLRRKLESRRIRLSTGLPAVLGAISLNLREIDLRYSRPHAFDTAAGTIVSCIDVVASDQRANSWDNFPFSDMPDGVSH